MSIHWSEDRKSYFFHVRYKDAFGKTKRYHSKYFKKQKDAKQAERDFLNELDKGKPNLMTYDYALEHYLKNSVLSKKTYKRKTEEHKLHILPFFENVRLVDLTTDQVNEFRAYCINHFGTLNSARAIFSTFRTVINYSIKYLKNTNNPVLGVQPIPRVRTNKETISREEFDERIKDFINIDYKELSVVLFYSGIRVGEGRGIKWKYVYFEDNEIFLAGKVDGETNEYQNFLKTDNSQSFIVLPPFVMEMLKARYEREKQKHKYFNKDYYVFGGMVPIWYSNYNTAFREVFPEITIHSLRHSYAKFLLDKGIPMYDLKDLLRHDDIKTTINTYGHFDRKGKHKSMKYFD